MAIMPYPPGMEWIGDLRRKLDLHEQALLWAVGTGKLPPTCPGHFMHLLIEAKEKVDKLNGASNG